MSDECTKPHPWGEFLSARVKVIVWLSEEMGKTDLQITESLSMDEEQVLLIRTHELTWRENVR